MIGEKINTQLLNVAWPFHIPIKALSNRQRNVITTMKSRIMSPLIGGTDSVDTEALESDKLPWQKWHVEAKATQAVHL